jgi:hemolysin III
MRGAISHSRFSAGEEIAHAVTHGLGAVGSLVGLAWLIAVAVPTGSLTTVVGVSVFGATMAILYLASTLYHALTAVRAKRIFELLDHGAIYLLIAGTYTPFCLVTLGDRWGWTVFGIAWGLAILGILYEVVLGRPWKRLSLAFYLALGWLIVIAVKPLMAALPGEALRLLLLGGLAYTGGTVFYAWRGFPYHHALWHLCVLLGTSLHFFCILLYVAPVR